MKEMFAYVLEFMLTLTKMQNNSTLMWKKFEIWGWSILKVIQAFHTVCIALYIECSGRVVDCNISIQFQHSTTGPEQPIYRTMSTV